MHFNEQRTIRTMFMAVSRRPNISKFYYRRPMTWAQLQNTAPSSIAITKSRKKKHLLHTENWWMHANQPQYLIETKWNSIPFECGTREPYYNTCNRWQRWKKKSKKNDIELNLCHLYIDSEYTHGPVISPCISIKGVITLDRDFFFFSSSVYGSFFPALSNFFA